MPKGHWPKGRLRNDPGVTTARLKALLQRVERFCSDHHQPGKISITAAAAGVGVSVRTFRRWLAGEDVPSADDVAALREWLDLRQRELAGKGSAK